MTVIRNFFRRMVSYTGPGLMLQELLYGFIMALIFITAAQMRIMEFNSSTNLIVLIIGMNFTWGLIDMIVFFMIDAFDQKSRIRAIRSKSDRDEKEVRAYIHEDLSGTIADVLDEEDERKIVDIIMKSRLEPEEQLRTERKDLFIGAFFCFVITMLTVIPVIMPLIFIPDKTTALFWSSGVAAIFLFFIGYYMAPYTGINKWKMGFMLTAASWVITFVATITGG